MSAPSVARPLADHTFDAAGPALTESFHEHGFVVLDAALSPDEIALVNAEAVRLCRGELGDISGSDEDAGAAGPSDEPRQGLSDGSSATGT